MHEVVRELQRIADGLRRFGRSMDAAANKANSQAWEAWGAESDHWQIEAGKVLARAYRLGFLQVTLVSEHERAQGISSIEWRVQRAEREPECLGWWADLYQGFIDRLAPRTEDYYCAFNLHAEAEQKDGNRRLASLYEAKALADLMDRRGKSLADIADRIEVALKAPGTGKGKKRSTRARRLSAPSCRKPVATERPGVDAVRNDAADHYRFAVALSFPGEWRDYVRQVDAALCKCCGRDHVFYDQRFEAELARIDLDTYLQSIYHNETELIVVFLCREYDRKKWCRLEWRAIRDIMQRRRADVMPFRFDDADVPGLFSSDGYVDAATRSPEQAAALIHERLLLNRASVK